MMESLLDEVDSLLAPGLSTETPDWCSNCQSLRQEIKRLQEEQLQNFGKLKQKIISTDLLIKKYKAKCDDYDIICKRNEDTNKKVDKFQRQCEILETQLKAALMDTEPLRKTKVTLEAEIRLKNAEIQSLSDRLLAAEGAQKQYEHLTKTSSNDIEKLEAEKKELLAKIRTLETGKLSKAASKEYKYEISVLRKEKVAMLKNEKRLESRLSCALAKIEHLSNAVKENKFSPKKRRRTSSGNRLSPLKSPGRSPRGDLKSSPVGKGRTRTSSERSAGSNIDVIPAQTQGKLSSDNESSSSDSDDGASICSVSWTFSPLTKCLSPLPPSPACLKERKAQHTIEMEKGGEMEEDGVMEEEMEDEVSDIADELEHQLLEEDEQQEAVENNGTKDDAVEEIGQTSVVKNPKVKDNAKTEEEIIKNTFDKQDEIKNRLGKNEERVEKDKLVGPQIENETFDDQSSIKERLAHSLDIVSPTAARKRIAHQSNQTIRTVENKNLTEKESKAVSENNLEMGKRTAVRQGKIPPIRRSARIRSLKENEISESELDITEAMLDIEAKKVTETNERNSEKSELNRNNTEEFTPVLSETTETLSDSENDSDKSLQMNVSKLTKDTCSDSVTAVDNSVDGVVLSLKNEVESETSLNQNNSTLDTHSNVIKTKDIEKIVEIKTGERKSDISQTNVPKVGFERQDLTKEEPTKPYKDNTILKTKADNKSVNEQMKCKFGSDKFINFQKSSSGSLAQEIEDFRIVDDYNVLTRDDRNTEMISSVIEMKPSVRKNIKRRMKKASKYIDLDSASYRDNRDSVPRTQSNDTSMQIPKVSREKNKVKRLKAVDNSVDGVVSSLLNFAEGSLERTNEETISEQAGVANDTEVKSESQELPKLTSETRNKHFSVKKETSIAQHSHQDQIKLSGVQIEKSTDSVHKGEHFLKDIKESKGAVSDANSQDTSFTDSGFTETVKKESVNNDNNDVSDLHLELEFKGLFNSNEKETPSRQMSTGFTVNTPTIERASSTESAVSFRNSPSRLFHLESGHCDTIVEEDLDKIENKKDFCEENEIKKSHDTSLILGVEDLLNDGIEKNTVGIEVDNAQNALKPVCDININANDSVTRTQCRLKSDSLVALDNVYNRPGCSYHYHEQSNQSEADEVSIITDAFKTASREGNGQLVSELSQDEENSLSRSSASSFTSINRASPVSPLSISPFNFLTPVSPLPPSPVKEIERVSPLSPEQLLDEQSIKTDVIKPDVVEHQEKDILENVIKDAASVDKDLHTERQESVFNTNCNLQVEKLKPENTNGGLKLDNKNEFVKLESKRESLQLENINEGKNVMLEKKNEGENINLESKNEVESVKLENNRDGSVKQESVSVKEKSTRKKIQKAPSASKDVLIDIDRLELFPLPNMISPVKTTNRHSSVKLKAEQMKGLILDKQIKQDNKTLCSDTLKSVEENSSQPKKFLTKAPGSALNVKPRLTRSLGSMEESAAQQCVRKSSQSALKRGPPTVKANETVAKKITFDSKGAFKQKVADCEKATEKTNNYNSKIDDTVNNSDMVSCKDAETEEETVLTKDATSGFVNEKGDNTEELPAGHDNLAFKRKTRVAHKPNIQSLKPQKIQIIDAPRLPPVIPGRKRKSLVRVTKETEDKKPCKENVFQKQKSASAKPDVNTDTNKMQAFLKSVESAESFVSKFSTEVSGESTGLQLLSTCLECLGRVRTDTLEVVYRVCESGQHLLIRDQFPFLSDVDKKAVHLIQYLWTELKIDATVIMQKIWDCVFSRDISSSVVGKMAQCRVFIALCSIQGDLELARALFYHLVTSSHVNYVLFITSVVSVWPDILMKDPSDRPDKVVSHVMTVVLEEIVTNMLQSQQSEANKKILLILTKLCNWSGSSGNASDIVKLLCHRLMTVMDEESGDQSLGTEVMKALELLCTNKSWEWVREHFIMRYGLQTAANKYLAPKIAKPISPNYVCAILQLTSRCMNWLSASIKSKDYQLIVKNWLLPVLSHKPGNQDVQQCCLETLMELSPLYITCLDSIQKWFKEEKSSVSQELVSRLEDMRVEYKKKFGLQCKPFTKA